MSTKKHPRKPRGHSALDIVRKYHPKVKKVVDALEPVVIQVTKADCVAGGNRQPNACALAKAARRVFEGAIVSVTRAYLVKGEVATRYMLPESVSREIVAFDRDARFEPGEYTLNRPSRYEGLGKSHQQAPRKDAGSARYANDRPRHHKTSGVRAL